MRLVFVWLWCSLWTGVGYWWGYRQARQRYHEVFLVLKSHLEEQSAEWDRTQRIALEIDAQVAKMAETMGVKGIPRRDH